jgi:DNA-binding FadR family transcriptional regulator
MGDARQASTEAPPAHAAGAATPSTLAEDVVFRPIRTGNVFEEAVERILHAIKLGVVTAGERLPPERKLAVRLGVSRVTVREALRVLEQAGYVEARRGRTGGTFVTYRATTDRRRREGREGREGGGGRAGREVGRRREPPAADLDDALTLRTVLEVGAAEVAAGRQRDGRLDEGGRRHLLERLADCERAAPAEYRQTDSRLHLAIAEAAGAPSLAAQVADVRMRINDLLDEIPLLAPNIAHSSEQHRAIVEAILAGDVAAARRTMEEHLDGTAALLRGFLAECPAGDRAAPPPPPSPPSPPPLAQMVQT